MDITEDSNTNSKNKLTLASGNEETMNSQESERDLLQLNPNAYSVFYHGSNNEGMARLGSKKNLGANKNKDLVSPYSNNGVITSSKD